MTPDAGKMKDRDRAAEVIERRRRSESWLQENYYQQWEDVLRLYLCEREPELDPNDPNARRYDTHTGSRLYDAQGRLLPASARDLTRTSLSMPDTWALARRIQARVTAQIPNLRFRAQDSTLAERISSTLMYQWDKAVQRTQKKHTLQAVLLGWSVKAWYWQADVRTRTRRVDPTAELPPDIQEAIHSQYMDQLMSYMTENPEISHIDSMARLVGEYGKGGLIPIKYAYQGYVGPRADFLFVGDCFPEPRFESIQTSNWFIVSRRRNRRWLEKLATAYPQLASRVEELFKEKPQGTPKSLTGSVEGQRFRKQALQAFDRSDRTTSDTGEESPHPDAEWLILEQHVPGDDASITYVCDGEFFLGEVPYPYELEGQIAFTELVLIDSLLGGIGDSNARVLRGLNALHDRQVNARFDLIHNVLRPLVKTTSHKLWENPEMLTRQGGFRLVKVDHPGELEVMGEQAALAAAAASMQDESGILRMIQLGSGENNMTMAANVDPQQGRTATGARLLAYNQDILSKDSIDMYNFAIKADAEMMYMLNRSELSEPIMLDAGHYQRSVQGKQMEPAPNWITVTAEDFQIDGDIEPEVGSTLADDDDAKLSKAQTLWGIAVSAPGLFNMEKARDRVLIAMGEARALQEWAAPPLQPPPPPEIRPAVSVSFKAEMLPPQVQEAVLQRAMGGPQMPQPGGPETPPMSVARPPNPPEGAGAPAGAEALEAATGRLR